jgi:hypothetical protein
LVTNGGSEDATSSKSAACKNKKSVSRAKTARTNRARVYTKVWGQGVFMEFQVSG